MSILITTYIFRMGIIRLGVLKMDKTGNSRFHLIYRPILKKMSNNDDNSKSVLLKNTLI